MIEWLEEAIQHGNEAANQLEEHQREELLNGVDQFTPDGESNGGNAVYSERSAD